MEWQTVFESALPYGQFLDKHATPSQRDRWSAVHQRLALSDHQRKTLGGFIRKMPVLCLAGAWCGDCINQCPAFDLFAAAAAATIDLRFLDRDAIPRVRDELAINGGQRVPVVVFLSEDFLEVSRYGDRTLSTYRRMAVQYLGPACSTGITPPEDAEVVSMVADWLGEFERAQLVLRLSPRLRQEHDD